MANHTFKTLEGQQIITTRFYCKWEHGAKEYFKSIEDAISKAEDMYVKKYRMSHENFEYWLSQKQIIGVETTIDTPIKNIYSPITVGI